MVIIRKRISMNPNSEKKFTLNVLVYFTSIRNPALHRCVRMVSYLELKFSLIVKIFFLWRAHTDLEVLPLSFKLMTLMDRESFKKGNVAYANPVLMKRIIFFKI